MVAARRDHLVETVWPALDAGNWVICDRFAEFDVAYQGYGGGVAARAARAAASLDRR